MTDTRRVAQPPAWWRQRYDAMIRQGVGGASARWKIATVHASYEPASVTRRCLANAKRRMSA
jgi:hypothetical protein